MTDLKHLTILIVEDENDLRRETAAFLELYFRKVYQAAEGRQALNGSVVICLCLTGG